MVLLCERPKLGKVVSFFLPNPREFFRQVQLRAAGRSLHHRTAGRAEPAAYCNEAIPKPATVALFTKH